MRFHHFRCVGVFAFVCLLTVVAQGQTTIYVDDDAATGGDGLSWATAFDDLQLALDTAKAPGSTVDEIRVGGGIYKPSVRAEPSLSRTETFQLINGVAIRGGYRGCPGGDCGGGDPDERDIVGYKTVFSGDLNGDDGPDFANNGENCYHVFYHPEELALDETAVLDGCTITAGNANRRSPSVHDDGGGMCNYYCSPTLTDCTIEKNAANDGGGIYCRYSSNMVITGCTIVDNFAVYNGGGIFSRSRLTLTDCTIAGNIAGFGGGYHSDSFHSPTFTRCNIEHNTAGFEGGGLYCEDEGSPTRAIVKSR